MTQMTYTYLFVDDLSKLLDLHHKLQEKTLYLHEQDQKHHHDTLGVNQYIRLDTFPPNTDVTTCRNTL